YPVRSALASALGMDPAKIRFINKYNCSTFGAARLAAERFYPLIAHLAKVTGRPVKVMLPKDQELAQLLIKPETITKFKVGAKKDGRITAIDHEVYVSCGDLEGSGHASNPGSATNQMDLYTSTVPHWRSLWCAYRTNANRPGPSRSYYQQETKWSWEIMMDEMAETLGLDPIEFRRMHVTKLEPGDTRHPYETLPSVEILEEGAKAFGWDKRNALPDSGSNHCTALAHLVAEMLGFTNRDRIRLMWGDTDIAPSSDEWFGGRTITLQGAATCSAADKLRRDLLERASNALKVDSAK